MVLESFFFYEKIDGVPEILPKVTFDELRDSSSKLPCIRSWDKRRICPYIIVCLLGGQQWQNQRGGGQGGGRGRQRGARGGVQGFSRGGGQGGARGGGRGRGNQQGTGFNYQQQSSSNRGGRGGRGRGGNNQSWNQDFSHSYTPKQPYSSSSYGNDDSFQWNNSGSGEE